MRPGENDDKKWIDYKLPIFAIYGTNHQFERLPLNVAEKVSAGVTELYSNPAGGRIRFCTNSKTMAVRAIVSQSRGVGFDLFRVDEKENREIFAAGFRRQECFICDGKFESRQVTISDGNEMIPYTLNFPYIGNLHGLEIGIDSDAKVEAGVPYRNERPVVFYGSSITQGAWASRPGSCYVSMISQRYNLNYLNLGFAGNARGERAMAEYMAGLDMCGFVCDYDHNAESAKELEQTHLPMYKTIRSAHPDIPYIMISRPDIITDRSKDNMRRLEIVRETCEYARANGDRNVAFIDGRTLLEGDYCCNCTRDGIHPNDLGSYRMAMKIGPVVAQMLGISQEGGGFHETQNN